MRLSAVKYTSTNIVNVNKNIAKYLLMSGIMRNFNTAHSTQHTAHSTQHTAHINIRGNKITFSLIQYAAASRFFSVCGDFFFASTLSRITE